MNETTQNNSYSYYADGSLNYAYMGSDVYYYSNNNRGNRTMNYFRDSDTVYHYTYSSYTTGNRISSAYSYDSDTGSTNKYNVTSYTYDANGNTLTTTVDGVAKTRAYSKRNEVTGYTDGGNSANNATYTYGADGLRTGKTVNGTKTTYIWSGGNIVAEITGSKYTVYLYGLNRISRGIMGTKYVKTGKAYDRYHELYLYDGHGNVVQTADEGIIDYLNAVHYNTSGDVAPEMDVNGDKVIDVSDLTQFLKTYPIINSYHYDAFGNQLDENTSSNTNPFRYCGEYWDSETGDIYLRARYYNPGTGRFTTVDPAMDGVNWYVYCKGNPIAFVDPWGLEDVMLRYIINKNGGSVEWNADTGSVTATIGETSKEYTGRNVNGRVIVDSDKIAEDFGLSGDQVLHTSDDGFSSLDDAVMAFGYMYYPKSGASPEWPNGCEYGAYLYENANGTFSFGEVPAAKAKNSCSLGVKDESRIMAGWVHTHPSSGSEHFSGSTYDAEKGYFVGDGQVTMNNKVPGFLVAPKGAIYELSSTWTGENVNIIKNTDPSVSTVVEKMY